jgi:hypothetical protein
MGIIHLTWNEGRLGIIALSASFADASDTRDFHGKPHRTVQGQAPIELACLVGFILTRVAKTVSLA